jgi:hypothetical protein
MSTAIQELEVRSSTTTVKKSQTGAPSEFGTSEWPYIGALAISVYLWLLPISSPLWLDETFSYWQIKGGFWQIWSRSSAWPCSALYPYFLWFAKEIGGKSEMVLRVPSVLAMLGAVYFLFRTAEKLFGRETAFVAAIAFSLHPNVAYAAIDARAYAFALLMTNLAAFLLVCWTRESRVRYAMLFGFACAGILYFHYLYVVVFPVFAIYYIIARWQKPVEVRQLVIAGATFAIAILPLVPLALTVLRTRNGHSFSAVPSLRFALSTLAPDVFPKVVLWALVPAVIARRVSRVERLDVKSALLCFAWALIPIFTLYGLSLMTPMRVFIDRYRLVAVPGIALFWAWVLNFLTWSELRRLACIAAAVLVLTLSWGTIPQHELTWKDALQAVQKNSSGDNAPVVICSDYVESDAQPLPNLPGNDNPFVSPISYYEISSPVVVLPRELTGYARQVSGKFVVDATRRRQRFFVLAFSPSFATVHFIENQSAATYRERVIGTYDGVAVVEFQPR